MKLNEDDVVKFYTFLQRYNEGSPNIGVTGKKSRFDNIIKVLYKDYKKNKNAKIIINPQRTKITILEDGQEKSYVYIGNSDNMTGYKFRKYI